VELLSSLTAVLLEFHHPLVLKTRLRRDGHCPIKHSAFKVRTAADVLSHLLLNVFAVVGCFGLPVWVGGKDFSPERVPRFRTRVIGKFDCIKSFVEDVN
jgi:hypothetical protein